MHEVDFEPTPFEPYPGLANPHLQTLIGRVVRSRERISYDRERVETPDGDFIDIDLVVMDDRAGGPGDTREVRAVCLVLHGLEGCSRSGYVVSACRALARHGILGAALNFRSCSGEPNRTVGSYHAGRTDDVRLALDWLARRFPDKPLLALGFSLGGNALLKHLGESREEARERLTAAAAVSVPFDLASAADELERGAGRVYAAYFLRSLRSKLRAKEKLMPGAYDLSDLGSVRTVREFDERFTAPAHGFRDAADYYASCSSRRFLPEVRIPTLLVQSRDDPLVPGPTIPWDLLGGNPRLARAITKHGGHVGFLARDEGPRARTWAEREAARFLAERAAQPGT